MAIQVSGLVHAKRIIHRSLSIGREGMPLKTPKGHFAVYVREEAKTRYMVPISYLDEPLFRDLLSRGGVRVPSSYGRPHSSLQRRRIP
ncbi:hypothetical protein CDL15_Pgr019622 [Punica granatum]|uniref:Auxin-responsive protein SAUR21-like n=1 Tax=Punica granatum TaxID=22663 RepID=A0A218X7I2_PUNGR|nr:hypothetical protein CDL15_Pgr019622 [Punica granatum]